MLNLQKVKEILKEFVLETGEPLELILIGGLALEVYGMIDRATMDIDAEIEQGDLIKLYQYLKNSGVPADLTENISGWSVIAMPENYRERAEVIFEDDNFVIKILDPYDFVIAKLRRGLQLDIDDALFVAKKYNLEPSKIKEFSENAIKNSVKDTAIFSFRNRVDLFLEELRNELENNS